MVSKEGPVMLHLQKKDKKTCAIITATPNFKKCYQKKLCKALSAISLKSNERRHIHYNNYLCRGCFNFFIFLLLLEFF